MSTTTSAPTLTISRRTVVMVTSAVIVAMALAVTLPLTLRSARTVFVQVPAHVTTSTTSQCAELATAGSTSAAAFRLHETVADAGGHC